MHSTDAAPPEAPILFWIMATRTTTAPSARAQGRKRGPWTRHSGRYLLSHGPLLARVTRNDLAARYVGSLLGVGWTVVTPALFLSVYAALYLFVYDAPVEGLTKAQFVVYLTSGIVPYLVTAEAIGNGVSAVVANRAVLTNVVFPIDLLPPKAVLLAQPTMAVGMVMTIIGALATGLASWYLLLVPVIWFFQVLALLGVTWILSLVNIVLRDLTQLIGILLILLLIASPIAYTTDKVPPSLRFIIAANPLAYFILAYHDVVAGEFPSPLICLGVVAFSLGSFALGGWFFSRMKAALIDYV
jgi:lipopolysaccharide transport system permease protein